MVEQGSTENLETILNEAGGVDRRPERTNNQAIKQSTMLHTAAANGDRDAVKILIAAGALVYRPDDHGVPPLDHALAEEKEERATINDKSGQEISPFPVKSPGDPITLRRVKLHQTRTLVAHCRMRSEGQVKRVLERMRHLGFLKNLLAELDEGIHRHNRRAATHGLQPVKGAKLFARISGHNTGDKDHITGLEAERLVAYPRKEELTHELTRTLKMLREEHPDEPLVHIPNAQLRGAIHDYLGCRQHETKRGRFKRMTACQSIRWTALPRMCIDGRQVRGLSMSLTPSYGAAPGGTERL